MGLTERIAAFIGNKTFSDFPPEAVNVAKMGIMDCLGSAVAGIKEDSVKMMTEFVTEQGGAKRCRVPGLKIETTAPLAALLIGTMAHALDYDDVNLSMRGHPSVPLVPVIFSLGDQLNISGERAVEAYLVGFEAQAKTGLFIGGDAYEKGWHYTMTVGVIGAAAAASKILGLDEGRVQTALGIAATMTGGLRENFGTMTKPLHAGLAAQNGVTAALLAQKGFTAAQGILEATYGLKAVISAGESMSEALVIERLEEDWDILFPGVGFKKYPCCYMSHQAVDAVLSLAHQHDLRPEQVKKVRVGVNNLIPKELIHRRPATPLEAKFSMEFCMAAALIDRRLGLAQFSDAKIKQAAPLMEKVEMYVREGEGEGFGVRTFKSRVEIELLNGERLVSEVEVPKGYPMDPLSWAELEEKFEECMATAFTSPVTGRCRELLRNLERLEQLSLLTGLLTDPKQ